MIKTVLIGCGKSGSIIANELSVADTEICGFCDLNIERARGLAEKFGGEAYSDYREMFEKTMPEVAVICTPPYCTDEIILCAAENGISFITESPVTGDGGRYNDILAKIEEKGIKTAVYDRLMYSKLMRVMKQFAAKNPIIRASFERVTPAPTEFWKRDCELCGGILIEKGVDVISAVTSLFGEIKRVNAVSSRGFVSGIADYSTDDCFTADLVCSCNAIVNITLGNYGVEGEDFSVVLNARGKRLELKDGVIRVYGDTFDPGRTKKMLHAGEIIPDEVEDGCLVYKDDCEMTPIKAFMSAISGGKADNIVSYAEGVHALMSAKAVLAKTVQL